MAAKPLTTETIALTEKKMDMTLDDIIKMSKGNGNKAKKQRRQANKSQGFLKPSVQEKSEKVRRYMDSRSAVRQGFLAQRRSNYQGNQFPLATEAAQKAMNAPFRNRAFAHNKMAGWKSRVGALPSQRKPVNGRFAAAKPPQQKPPQQHQMTSTEIPKQRTQTLDSLFANMKEERMRTLSRKNNAVQSQHNRTGGQQRPPWRRNRFATDLARR